MMYEMDIIIVDFLHSCTALTEQVTSCCFELINSDSGDLIIVDELFAELRSAKGYIRLCG